jgi:cysteine-rich repeat protein
MSRLRITGITASIVFGGALALAACSADSADPDLSVDGGGSVIPDSGITQAEAGTDGPVGEPDGGAPAVCGNGKVEGGEICDDGNEDDGDGCSAKCTVESAFEGDACPGKAIPLTPNGQLLVGTATGSTKGAFNHYGSACGGGSAPDVVYAITSPSSGKAIVTLTADFSAIVSARTTCALSTSESKCADVSSSTGGTTTMEVPVFANTPVYLVVDGYGGSAGGFTLDVAVSTAVCGNGVAELPETCDDGNKTNGDGCSATCTLEAGGVLTNCPGQPFALSGAAGAPRKISFAGNTLTSGQPTQSPSGCFYWAGSNVVYAVQSDVAGSVKAELLAGYEKANLHARSECGSNSYQLGCTQIEAPGTASVEFPVSAGQWFYLFVDGHKSGSKDYAGPYSLDVTVTPSSCGNGLLDGDEECDDGNAAAGDGCSAACKREALAGVDTCPGHPVTLAAEADGSRTAVLSGTTLGLSNAVSACANTFSSSAGDAIYAVTPDIDGYLTATVRGPFNSTVSVLADCTAPAGAPASVLACSFGANASTDPFVLDGLGSIPKTARTPVKAGTTYYVVVDGHFGSGTLNQGPYRLDLRVTPAVCGNGVIEGTETCDDGGTDANDGCDAACQLEPVTSRSTCGDAEAITLTETAPGNWSTSLARGTTNLLANANFATSASDPCFAPGKNAFFSVTAPAAGVLRATAKSTQLDVVLGVRKPSCALTGAPLLCANDSGKGNEETVALPVTAGETVWLVVDGKSDLEFGRFTLDVAITPSGCGDGFFVPGPTEQCDDGNTSSGDGCSATCTLEAITGVDTCPGKTLTLSGTGTSRKGTLTFSTEALNANYVGACGGNAKDGVVRVVAPIGGTLKAKARNMTGATVYARTTCIDPTTEIAKSQYATCTGVVHDTVTIQATAGTEYFLFVDGLEGATGVPTLDVSITP